MTCKYSNIAVFFPSLTIVLFAARRAGVTDHCLILPALITAREGFISLPRILLMKRVSLFQSYCSNVHRDDLKYNYSILNTIIFLITSHSVCSMVFYYSKLLLSRFTVLNQHCSQLLLLKLDIFTTSTFKPDSSVVHFLFQSDITVGSVRSSGTRCTMIILHTVYKSALLNANYINQFAFCFTSVTTISKANNFIPLRWCPIY